jgi:hypothetical protein
MFKCPKLLLSTAAQHAHPCNLRATDSGMMACAVAGRRSKPVGAIEPVEKHRPRSVVPSTRTVAWDASEARLRKDGTRWTPSLSESTYRRTGWTSRCARPVHRAIPKLYKQQLADLRWGKLEVIDWSTLTLLADFDPYYLHLTNARHSGRRIQGSPKWNDTPEPIAHCRHP